MSEKVIIIGAGGHGKVIADIIESSGDTLLGFLDDNPLITESFGYKVIGKISDVSQFEGVKFIIAIGNNLDRKKIAESCKVEWYTAVHPSAVLARDVVVGCGSVVMANAVINASGVVGVHSIINTSAVIEHDCEVGDYSHVSPNATLCGTVKIGKNVHVGAGAVIINNLSVTSDTVIGAGAVVIRDITQKGTYAGVPARML